MPSPFPGMDPYLEKPSRWPEHPPNFISTTQGLLASQLRPSISSELRNESLSPTTLTTRASTQSRVPDVEVALRPAWEQTAVVAGRSGGITVNSRNPWLQRPGWKRRCTKRF